ncbi:MAG: DUF4221 family protein [Bacteroidetes bacterium]|uniref:DUF4221 family protein n=1 Tax=Candidatus Cryptobacteroides excrementipullorum TaxID=2840761 RepID=A0A9D9ISA0_9BACT|nr:DUF4221 family protein [Candidatus Cryptobacteroides excrementipullorum]
MIKYIKIILFVILTSACNNLLDNKRLYRPCDVDASYNKNISITKTLNINVPKGMYSGYHSFFLYKNRYFYGVHTNSPNVIDVYDIQNETFLKRIEIDSSLVNDRVSGIYVSSSDSIFFCQINPNRIYLIDSNGYIVNRWLQDDLMIKIADDEYLSRYDITFTTFLGQFRPLVLDNHIIIGLDPSGMYKVISNIKRVGIYDMVHKKWNKFISKASDVESNISKLGYPYDLEQPYIADGDKCIIVSYPMDHYIYVYSKSNYEFISKVPCYSKYVSYLPYPLPLKQINSCQKNWNFRVQVPFYGAVNYHPEKDMYTRIIYHPQSLIDDNGNVNSGMDRSASIIIMNNQFEIIGETLFDKGQLGVYSYLPMSDGLLTAPQINNDYDSIFNYKNIMTLE